MLVLTVMGFDQGDTKAGLAKAINYHNDGNNKHADEKGDAEELITNVHH